MAKHSHYTPMAARRWTELGARSQTLLLNNVWCIRCRKVTTIVRFTGKIERQDLILQGECIRCGGSVARVVEAS
jgi:hypothetical protein